MENEHPTDDLSGCVTPIQVDAGFLLKLEGQSVVSLKLPSKVAKQLSGEEMKSQGIISRLKARLKRSSEADRWLTLTVVDNPLLEHLDTFRALVAEGLTSAGVRIEKHDLTIAATVPVSGVEEQFDQTVLQEDQDVLEKQFVDK